MLKIELCGSWRSRGYQCLWNTEVKMPFECDFELSQAMCMSN